MSAPYGTGHFADIPDADLAAVESHPDAGENPTLESFLDALDAVLESIPRNRALSHRREDRSGPAWQLVAGVLVGASGYE